MDKMQDYEVNLILDNIEYADRVSWEQIRLIMYQNIQMNTKKKINIKDVIKFKWENVDNNSSDYNKDISIEDIKRLKQKANSISKMINNK